MFRNILFGAVNMPVFITAVIIRQAPDAFGTLEGLGKKKRYLEALMKKIIETPPKLQITPAVQQEFLW
jgi:hypothetical protein